MRISDWSSDVCSSDLTPVSKASEYPMRGALRIHEADNVATAIADIAPGEALFADRDIRAAVAVERGHKIALAPIPRGEAVTKYGFSIGTPPAELAPRDRQAPCRERVCRSVSIPGAC